MKEVATVTDMRGISPSLRARIAGLVYVLIFVAAPSGAASATPLKMAIDLLADVCVAILLYDLLRPVSKILSLLTALFRLIFVLVMAVVSTNYFGLTSLLQASHSAAAFDAGYGIALVPFGVHCVLVGYLVFRSTFLPRALGVLMAVAGFAYLFFLWPQLGSRLFFPWLVIPAVLGEGALTLWLLIMGVNDERWRQRNELR